MLVTQPTGGFDGLNSGFNPARLIIDTATFTVLPTAFGTVTVGAVPAPDVPGPIGADDAGAAVPTGAVSDAGCGVDAGAVVVEVTAGTVVVATGAGVDAGCPLAVVGEVVEER